MLWVLKRRLGDSLELLDLRDVGFEISLDADLEGHGAGRAADAGAVEADADGSIRGDVDEFDVAAVGLDGGPDEVEDGRDSAAEVCGVGVCLLGHGEGYARGGSGRTTLAAR